MSMLNSESRSSSRPVFPYAKLPEKKAASASKKRTIVIVLVLVAVVAGVAGVLLLG